MIERQRRNADNGSVVEMIAEPGVGLLDVVDEVAVRQHRTFSHPGGAAGVLQKRQIVERQLGAFESAGFGL